MEGPGCHRSRCAATCNVELSGKQAARSFSLVFMDHYVDVIALNQASYDIWVKGLQELGDIRRTACLMMTSGVVTKVTGMLNPSLKVPEITSLLD